MFSMSMTRGPWRTDGVGWHTGSANAVENREAGESSPALSSFTDSYFLSASFDHHLRAVLELAADRAVTAGDHFVARFDAALDFDVRVVGDAGGDLHHLRLAAVLEENDFFQLLALFLCGLSCRDARSHLGVVVGLVLARRLSAFSFRSLPG